MTESVLITGCVRRLGKIIACHLADLGYHVWLQYLRDDMEAENTCQQINRVGGSASLIKADLQDTDEIIRMFDFIRENGELTTLINNAAIFYRSNLATLSVTDWDRLFDINLRAVWLCSREAAKLIGENPTKSGLIINMSDSGSYQYWKEYGGYTLSKAAVRDLTILLAKTFAPKIRVNSISPGLILPEESMDEKTWKYLSSETLLKKSGEPEDILNAVDYLMKSDYITGIDIPVDGGYRWK